MWKTILNLAVTVVLYFFKKNQDKAEARTKFLEFIDIMSGQGMISVQLNDADRTQVQELKARRKFIEGKFNKKVGKMQKARRRSKRVV